MVIEYIQNTCDVNGITAEGEIAIFFVDGKVAYHHDLSNSTLEMDAIQDLMSGLRAEVEFVAMKPSKKQIKEINEFLSKEGY